MNLQATQSFTVNSSVISNVEFGTVVMANRSIPAIGIRFNSGAEYIYIGVPQQSRNMFWVECQTGVSVGQSFNRYIRPCQSYARLSQAVV